MKVLEVRIKCPDSVSDRSLKLFGEHLQEYIPEEFESMPEFLKGFENEICVTEDVTFEIKAVL